MTNDTPPQAELSSLLTMLRAVLRAREIAAEFWDRFDTPSHRSFAASIRSGEKDDCEAVQIALLAAAPPQAIERSAREGLALFKRLRDEEADSVTLLFDNPEGPPNNAVECCGFWTGFAERRFEGVTINAALAAAVAAKDYAASVGYPGAAALATRSPIGERDREQIARIIAPGAWDGVLAGHWTESTKLRSLAKADAIIALLANPVIGEGGK